MKDLLDPKDKLKKIMNGGTNEYNQYPNGVITKGGKQNDTIVGVSGNTK